MVIIVCNVFLWDFGYMVLCVGVFLVGDIIVDKILISVIRCFFMVWDIIVFWVEMWFCVIKFFNKIILWLCWGVFWSWFFVCLKVLYLVFYGFEMRVLVVILVCCYMLICGILGMLMELICFLLRIYCSVSKYDVYCFVCWENMFVWFVNLFIN